MSAFLHTSRSALAFIMLISVMLPIVLTACNNESGSGTGVIVDSNEISTGSPFIPESTAPGDDTTGVEDVTTGAEDVTTGAEDVTTGIDEVTTGKDETTTAPVPDDTTSPVPDDTTAPVPDDTTSAPEDTTAPPETTGPEVPGVAEGEMKYNEALVLVGKGKFMQASKYLADISVSDVSYREKAKALIAANTAGFTTAITEAVTEYMVRYQIPEGEKYLNSLLGMGIDSYVKAEAERLENYRIFQDVNVETVYLNQTLENIYTHCLIAFPEINFKSKYTYRNCGDDCLTPNEFRYLLNRLYDLGYIIIDANLLYDEAKDAPVYSLKLPKGKKPLVFTFDDVTYDSRKMGKGMVDKIIVDEDGYVCTYTEHKDGTVVVSYDNELFPIINSFVREHPDFTYHGGRGTLFFTGFDGILGYRTQSNPIDDAEAALGLDRNVEIAKAKVVVEALRAEGWTFGSHSYNHSHMTRLSAEKFKWDTDTWLEEVGSIIGETKLFCWPFGDHTDANYNSNLRKGELHKYLFDSGFKVFFGCGAARYLANELDGLGIFTDRKGMTGNVLYYIDKGYQSYLKHYLYLIDPEEMWDEYRLPYRYMK